MKKKNRNILTKQDMITKYIKNSVKNSEKKINTPKQMVWLSLDDHGKILKKQLKQILKCVMLNQSQVCLTHLIYYQRDQKLENL